VLGVRAPPRTSPAVKPPKCLAGKARLRKQFLMSLSGDRRASLSPGRRHRSQNLHGFRRPARLDQSVRYMAICSRLTPTHCSSAVTPIFLQRTKQGNKVAQLEIKSAFEVRESPGLSGDRILNLQGWAGNHNVVEFSVHLVSGLSGSREICGNCRDYRESGYPDACQEFAA